MIWEICLEEVILFWVLFSGFDKEVWMEMWKLKLSYRELVEEYSMRFV